MCGGVLQAESDTIEIRRAGLDDLGDLLALEQACFETDRISRRSFRRFLTGPRATILLAEIAGLVVGYALVLFRLGTVSARLYSIAVDKAYRGRGIGRKLVEACEDAAIEADRIDLRLEVRIDNAAAIKLYQEMGFSRYRFIEDYYEDHGDAWQLRKWLRYRGCGHHPPPYYVQTSDFTCGPAAVMIVMAAFDPATELSRMVEFRLWREATTVFMAAGHGGCEPIGLALTLFRRGFDVEVRTNREGPYFAETVRRPAEREAMELVQADYAAEAARRAMPITTTPLSRAELLSALDEGALVIMLLSYYRMTASRQPHWVVIFAHDGRRVFVHDPCLEPEDLETANAAADLPIPLGELDRMRQFGQHKLQAAIVVRSGPLR